MSETAVMSFDDDKIRWKDAAHRILNLQQCSGGTLNTNLNVILDELNSLDYATSIVENEEVRALKVKASQLAEYYTFNVNCVC